MKSLPSLFGGLILVCGATAALAQTGSTPSAAATVPARPTLGPAAAATLTTVQRVCLPLLAGAKPKMVATAAGVRIDNGAWTLPIHGKQRVDVDLPDGSNPHLCSATITYPAGEGATISAALDAWAKSQTPPLAPIKVNDHTTGASYLRTTWTWEGSSTKGAEAIVLSQEKTLQGRPVAGDLDQAELLVSLTPS